VKGTIMPLYPSDYYHTDPDYSGYHQFHGPEDEHFGSFEIFYNIADPKNGWPILAENEGYFWWACFPDCLPDGEPNGPFKSTEEAYINAQEYGEHIWEPKI
jgi:hypothetical protein